MKGLRHKLKLSTKGMLLLSFILMPILLSHVFVGILAIGLAFLFQMLIVPFAHLISFKELYIVECYHWLYLNIKQIIDLPISMGFISSSVPISLSNLVPFMYFLLPIFWIVTIPIQALMSCLMLRLIYYVYPKRLKIEKVGY